MDEEMLNQAESQTESETAEEKAISSDLIRGHINTIILRSLYDGDKYGYEIIAEIERKSHGQYSMKQPSLYSALKRLESQGFITSYWGGSVGGGRRKYFSLTEDGRAISERNQSEWEYSRTVIDSLISDKEFDFSNPAPTAVDMRVLKKSTTRVFGFDDEEDLEGELAQINQARFDEERARNQAAMEEESARLREELEERIRLFDEEKLAADEERVRMIAELKEKEIALSEEQTRLREELEEKQRLLEEERENLRTLQEQHTTQETLLREEQASFGERQKELELQMEQEDALRMEELHRREQELDEQRKFTQETLAAREQALEEERLKCEEMVAERERWLEEEREKHAQELVELERRVREEQAREFAAREKHIIHQNYLQLVNTPPTATKDERDDYNYFTQPIAESSEDKKEEPFLREEQEYRSVVQKLYSNSVRSDLSATDATPKKAQSLGTVDFYDLEERAAQDGIKIYTAGGGASEKERESESVVHKGKALFLSAIVAFVFCLAEGSVLLALLDKLAIPTFYPYFIWAVGLSVLLICGLAYANRYGERALRQTGNLLINCIVAFVLLSIFTLVLALAIKIDFANIGELATFVIVPIVFFLNIVIFAVTYVLQIKKRK